MNRGNVISIAAGAALVALVAALAEAVLGSHDHPPPESIAAPPLSVAKPVASADTIFDLGAVPPVSTIVPPPPPPLATVAPTVVPEPTPRLPPGEALIEAEKLSLAGDNAGARAVLEPRVFGGHGSEEEVLLLKGICRAQHDRSCTAAIAAKYP